MKIAFNVIFWWPGNSTGPTLINYNVEADNTEEAITIATKQAAIGFNVNAPTIDCWERIVIERGEIVFSSAAPYLNIPGVAQ
jgi:hypothetical protein